MSGKRVFQIIVGIALVAAALLVVQRIAKANNVAVANQRALHQYRLTERYGETPQQSVSPQLMHLYQMGERYGESPYTASGAMYPLVLKELAQVRQATAKYHDVNVALADGFIATPNCISDPKLGGMGIHYINPARLMDPAVNILEPEILLYSRTSDGMKLLGVEYMFAIGAPDTHVPNPAPPAPVIFGRSLDGPMEQHEPGQPPHYDLHVWIWKANPAGTFAMFNPNVSCQ